MHAASLDPRHAAALADESALADCTSWRQRPDGLREATTRLALGGLHCAACAGLIEAALCRVPGVAGAEVNAAAQRASVRWDPARTSAANLIDAVQRAGYSAHPARSDAALQAQRDDARLALWRLFVAAFSMMQVMMVATPSYVAAPDELAPDLDALLRWAGWVMTLPVMFFCATPFFRGAWQSLRAGRVGMDVPVALGIAIAFVASTGATFDPGGAFGREVWFDSLTMFVAFLLAGRWLEQRLRLRSAGALDALLRELPDSVERALPTGGWERVAISRLAVGDRVRIVAGQAFAGDGRIVQGRTSVDEALLSGESRPVERGQGDEVVAGSVNLAAPVEVLIERLGADTRHRQIVDLMERALSERPALLRTADRVAAPFVVVVLLVAMLAALVWQAVDPARALSVAIAVLIVTCPCALSLAAPTALLAAAGALARRGVLVQRLDAIEALARVDVALFDKTGTLTEDRLSLVQATRRDGGVPDQREFARAVALAQQSSHPLARSLASLRASTGFEGWRSVREEPGRGVEAIDEANRAWRLGSAAWVGVDTGEPQRRPAVWFAPLGQAGRALRFEFDEVLRADALGLVEGLRADGVEPRLLSGDQASPVAAVAERLHLRTWRHGASPQDKLAELRALQRAGHRVLMVGDGLNDGPVIAQADVSVALGHGAALAQQRADMVVLGSRLGAVREARALAARAMRTIRQNLAWALVYNAASVPLALAGWLPPWAAGLGMAASSLIVIGNALRLAR